MWFPLEILLSNERGCTLNFTSILDVVDLLPCISCIIHFPSAALSAFTASSAVFLLNKDISNFFVPIKVNWAVFLQSFEAEKSNSLTSSLLCQDLCEVNFCS